MPVQPDAFRIQSYLELVEALERVEGTGNGIGGLSREAFTDALRDLVRMFESLQVRFALFGAFAVAAYVANRRSTVDIDIISSGEAIDSVRKSAESYGFREMGSQDADARVVCFRHRGGAKVDIIFDSVGFADLDSAHTVQFPGVGDIPVAAAVDVAYSKIRTQDPSWKRQRDKQLIDRADLIAMFRAHHDLVRDLRQRLSATRLWTKGGQDARPEMVRILDEVAREAGIPLDDSGVPVMRGQWAALAVTLVILVLLITGVAFLLAWLAQ